ncbi:MAG TPA: hypothetical protein VED16_05600 [Candidatus Acidoferrum sp.]|nr:hypothetical protein [Candidatus Acidoferrum sp.]
MRRKKKERDCKDIEELGGSVEILHNNLHSLPITPVEIITNISQLALLVPQPITLAVILVAEHPLFCHTENTVSTKLLRRYGSSSSSSRMPRRDIPRFEPFVKGIMH